MKQNDEDYNIKFLDDLVKLPEKKQVPQIHCQQLIITVVIIIAS